MFSSLEIKILKIQRVAYLSLYWQKDEDLA